MSLLAPVPLTHDTPIHSPPRTPPPSQGHPRMVDSAVETDHGLPSRAAGAGLLAASGAPARARAFRAGVGEAAKWLGGGHCHLPAVHHWARRLPPQPHAAPHA